MRFRLLLSLSMLSVLPSWGCTQQWGVAEVRPRPALDTSEAHLGDSVVQRMLALRDDLDSALSTVEQQLAADARRPRAPSEQLADILFRRGIEQQPSGQTTRLRGWLERRLTLTRAMRLIDGAIERRRQALARGESIAPPRWLGDDEVGEALLEQARAELRAARHRDAPMAKAKSKKARALSRDRSARPAPPAGAPPPGARASGGEQGVDDDREDDVGAASKGGGTRERASVVPTVDDVDRTAELDRHVERLRGCLPPALARERMVVTITGQLAADGAFRSAQVQGVEGLPAEVGACLVDVMLGIRVTPPRDGSMLLSFPLTLGGRE